MRLAVSDVMAKRVKLEVKLLAHTYQPQQVVAAAIRQCYSAVGARELKEKTSRETQRRLIRQIVSSGHTSTIEHASFTFAIEGISRSCSQHLIRHRIASYSQQSHRYVDLSKQELTYIMPPEVENNPKLRRRFQREVDEQEKKYNEMVKLGINPEDARYILPNGVETKIVVTMNARSLHNFFRLRCCQRAQWEIQALAWEMLRLVKKEAPDLFANAGPSCITEKICWEGNLSCGTWKKIKGGELRSR